MSRSSFKTEAELCAAFITAATADGKWQAYPETEGFDILLVRQTDRVQIGVEAKLTLNVKVLLQALPDGLRHNYGVQGPDYRAILVPNGASDKGLGGICAALGITILRFRGEPDPHVGHPLFSPDLPREDRWGVGARDWHEWAPLERCHVPDYVPDVAAGMSAPVALTQWKVKAIKLAILLEDRPITRGDFKALELSPSRWTDPWSGWLVKAGNGCWSRGPKLPDFKAQHPRNYEEIKADRARWEPKCPPFLEPRTLFGTEAAE